MSKRVLCCCVVTLMLFLTGCNHVSVALDEPEATATYHWMAGESPVSERRMGVVRYGLNLADNYAVSPKGIYFIPDVIIDNGSYQQTSSDTFVLYADNGSADLNKLCGRNDCTHDSPDCNAYLYKGSDLSYYQGNLYAVSGEGPHTEECKLVRMNPDGSGHEELLDLLSFAKEHGAAFLLCDIITDGYCVLDLYNWEEQPDGTSCDAWLSAYKYKLDGSMEEPELMEEAPDILYQCGDVIVTRSYETVDGMEKKICCDLNFETEEETLLAEHPGVPAWFGENEAYYFKDGAIRQLTYATNEETVLVNTALEGNYFCFVFPDCLVLASQDDEEGSDRKLYFYNWAFELVDTVSLNYPITGRTQFAVFAETVDRVVLTDQIQGSPLCYIDKSELGTGNVSVHAFQYSD